MGGDVIVGGLGSSGKNQSELSKSVTPPEREDPLPSGPVMAGCLLSGLALVLFIVFTGNMSLSENPSLRFWGVTLSILVIVFAISAIVSKQNNPEANAKYEEAMKLYEKKRVCMRCGNVYIGD